MRLRGEGNTWGEEEEVYEGYVWEKGYVVETMVWCGAGLGFGR